MTSAALHRCLRGLHSSGRRFLSSSPPPPGRKDRYGGVTLDIGELTQSDQCAKLPEEFDKQLSGWLSHWRSFSVKAAWLDIPIELGTHMTIAARHGFTLHNAEGATSTMCQWLDESKPSGLPRFATHQVGCSGCVVREDTQQVLVVKDRYNPYALWKFPGGLSELNEDIEATAVREVLEETGIQTEFHGVMMFRQQHRHPGAFGRSDFFFVCRLIPLNYDITLDPREITHCEWMGLNELEDNAQKSAITIRAIQMVRQGLQEGFDSVTLSVDTCKSVYKGFEFKVHNPRVPGMEEVNEEKYMHSIEIQKDD